ncbi:dephospho-CoA kinase [Membranihabitans maritimus]|uniref:dephospho-CoA kinase n=1 Tax=Membranihabitans maritimus TaxID=2904244 RepID=UPI001EEDE327|nr:dephospho-CoA kinase [Membranihabitans maritimus]
MTKKKIGITGGIGSGKSHCLQIFNNLGISTYIADIRATMLMVSSPDLIKDLINLLGKDIYQPNGKINKKRMSEAVFDNPYMRKKINNIVHPAVGQDYEEWHSFQSSKYTLKEAALLIESQSYKSLDFLIVVTAPQPIRIQRVMQRDTISEVEVRNRINSQMKEEEKLSYADYIIDNSGTIPLLPQILEIHSKLLDWE